MRIGTTDIPDDAGAAGTGRHETTKIRGGGLNLLIVRARAGLNPF